jgi:hypothetical protein
MPKSLAQLTKVQQAAYAKIKEYGVWYSYNDISRATVSVLEREGFVTVEWSVSTWTNYRSKRSHSQCDWTARPVAEEPKAPAKNPHVSAIVRLINQELRFERANVPVHGGYAVTQSAWDMVPVAFVHWAYAGDNMRERGLSDEVRKIAELLLSRGYALAELREDRNYFFVVPESLKSIA